MLNRRVVINTRFHRLHPPDMDYLEPAVAHNPTTRTVVPEGIPVIQLPAMLEE